MFFFFFFIHNAIAFFFFFNDTATTEIYTLSLHDALPISWCTACRKASRSERPFRRTPRRSEEHTSELQSHSDLVCRLLLEKKNKNSIERYGDQLNITVKTVTEQTAKD